MPIWESSVNFYKYKNSLLFKSTADSYVLI
jgi:hypothetical protein